MKILAIILLLSGALGLTIRYLIEQKKLQSRLCEWAKLISAWAEWVSCFRYSTEELILHSFSDELTSNLEILDRMKKMNFKEICSLVEKEGYLDESASKLISGVLKELGMSVVETEVTKLKNCVISLEKIISEKEIILRNRSQMLYKLVPLLCFAIAILLW